MKVITLMEDTCGNPNCFYEHGLSVYIETRKHKLLLDTGASKKTIENAHVLGIDLSKVDTVVLSHGHYDHSGGILDFATLNPNAKIYMQKEALDSYYHGERYIGIDKRIAELPQVKLLVGDVELDEELYLFSNITGRRFWPQSNLALTKVENGKHIQDAFHHEQCLVITQDSKQILLSGCAHNGILNLLDRYDELYQQDPAIVVSGFHMNKKGEYSLEEVKTIEQTAEELKKRNTIFYTGHCTGEVAYQLMKPILGDQLRHIHSGLSLDL